MLKQDKIDFIWNYMKNTNFSEIDYETLSNEDNDFLDICLEDICEYEDWNVHGLNKYKAW